MQKNIALLLLLVAVCAITGARIPDEFLSPGTIKNILQWTSLYGVLAIGAAFVIITGGIDLSLGSMAALTACLLAMFLRWGLPGPAAAAAAIGVAGALGWVHGMLVTRMRLQPFVVTLCALLIYRGLARFFTGDATQGFSGAASLKSFVAGAIQLPGRYSIPYLVFVLLGLALAAAFVLNYTVFGRYLFALGRNEQAARYSGIDTRKFIVSAYVLASAFAGLGGVLLALDLNSVQPASFAEGYELYAIAACVLGGCSLRGGEGSVFGLVIGTALIEVLTRSITLLGVQDTLKPTTIGVVILLGVATDEVAKRYHAARQRKALAKGGTAAPPAEGGKADVAAPAASATRADSASTPVGKS